MKLCCPTKKVKAKVACTETIKNNIYFIPKKKRYVMVAAKLYSCIKDRETDPYVRPETACINCSLFTTSFLT